MCCHLRPSLLQTTCSLGKRDYITKVLKTVVLEIVHASSQHMDGKNEQRVVRLRNVLGEDKMRLR